MSQIEASKLADYATPPRSDESDVVAVTGTAGHTDLTTVGNQTPSVLKDTGITGHYVTFQNDGSADIYLNFGTVVGDVTGGNVPDPTATGINHAGNCYRLPAGEERNWIPRKNVDNFVGYVSTGTSTLRIFKTSY